MKPIDLIDALRKSDKYIEVIFMQGGCYQFYKVLKSIWSDAIPLMNDDQDHVITEIDGKFYDICGEVSDEESAEFMMMNAIEEELASTWSFGRNYQLKVAECPACEEPIGV